MPLTIVVENQPHPENRVLVGSEKPQVEHAHVPDYTQLGLEAIKAKLPEILKPLPVEKIIFKNMRPTESHMECSLRMGRDRETSVIDASLLHHDVRNLAIVGTSIFPTCPNMNPSLTAAALSLMGSDRLLS